MQNMHIFVHMFLSNGQPVHWKLELYPDKNHLDNSPQCSIISYEYFSRTEKNFYNFNKLVEPFVTGILSN